jgi:hypothetical protein
MCIEMMKHIISGNLTEEMALDRSSWQMEPTMDNVTIHHTSLSLYGKYPRYASLLLFGNVGRSGDILSPPT